MIYDWKFDRILLAWQLTANGEATDYIVKGTFVSSGEPYYQMWRLREGQKVAEFGSEVTLETAQGKLIVAFKAVKEATK